MAVMLMTFFSAFVSCRKNTLLSRQTCKQRRARPRNTVDVQKCGRYISQLRRVFLQTVELDGDANASRSHLHDLVLNIALALASRSGLPSRHN